MESLNLYPYKTINLFSNRQADINKAVEILKNHGTVALPTETVYGLAGNAFSPIAVQKIYQAKNRPLKNPLIFHVPTIEEAQKLFAFSQEEEKRFLKLAHRFWPGPLTIVAKKARHITKEMAFGLDTIAVRIPNHVTVLQILSSLDFPVVMPSANLSTRPSPTTASHVFSTLSDRIDAVLDAGPCQVGIESTVVRIDGEAPSLLRLGIITKGELSLCLGEEIKSFCTSDTVRSPGQAYLHYSPAVKDVILCAVNEAKDSWLGENIVLAKTQDYSFLRSIYGERSKTSVSLMLSNDPCHYAKELYGALHEAEKWPDKVLYIITPGDDDPWLSILDRLSRAAN